MNFKFKTILKRIANHLILYSTGYSVLIFVITLLGQQFLPNILQCQFSEKMPFWHNMFQISVAGAVSFFIKWLSRKFLKNPNEKYLECYAINRCQQATTELKSMGISDIPPSNKDNKNDFASFFISKKKQKNTNIILTLATISVLTALAIFVFATSDYKKKYKDEILIINYYENLNKGIAKYHKNKDIPDYKGNKYLEKTWNYLAERTRKNVYKHHKLDTVSGYIYPKRSFDDGYKNTFKIDLLKIEKAYNENRCYLVLVKSTVNLFDNPITRFRHYERNAKTTTHCPKDTMDIINEVKDNVGKYFSVSQEKINEIEKYIKDTLIHNESEMCNPQFFTILEARFNLIIKEDIKNEYKRRCIYYLYYVEIDEYEKLYMGFFHRYKYFYR